MQGNFGAATTIKEWTDFQDNKRYPGFPYAVWKKGGKICLKTQPPIEKHRPLL